MQLKDRTDNGYTSVNSAYVNCADSQQVISVYYMISIIEICKERFKLPVYYVAKKH